jgi:hypothetical protein
MSRISTTGVVAGAGVATGEGLSGTAGDGFVGWSGGVLLSVISFFLRSRDGG